MKKQIKTILKQVAAAAVQLSVRRRWMLDASTRLKNQYGETPQQEYARIMRGVSRDGSPAIWRQPFKAKKGL
jgi:hypothetical protein